MTPKLLYLQKKKKNQIAIDIFYNSIILNLILSLYFPEKKYIYERKQNFYQYFCFIFKILFFDSFSLPARWGLMDFILDVRLLLLVDFRPPFLFLFPHSFLPRRTSSVSSWSQQSSPGLICQLLIAVVAAGFYLLILDLIYLNIFLNSFDYFFFIYPLKNQLKRGSLLFFIIQYLHLPDILKILPLLFLSHHEC